jgi:hypothetical protein
MPNNTIVLNNSNNTRWACNLPSRLLRCPSPCRTSICATRHSSPSTTVPSSGSPAQSTSSSTTDGTANCVDTGRSILQCSISCCPSGRPSTKAEYVPPQALLRSTTRSTAVSSVRNSTTAPAATHPSKNQRSGCCCSTSSGPSGKHSSWGKC